jgi:hypothetical protein
MTGNGILQLVVYFGVLLLLAKPLGVYMARVYEGTPSGLDLVLGPVERLFYRICGINPDEEMSWKKYAAAVLMFSAGGLLLLYALQRVQGFLPLNPQKFPAVSPDSSFNTAVSFITNTNWQGYGGETTMSYLTQMLGLAVQNFVSAAAGMAVLVAFVRGFRRVSADTIGNFWVDLTRTVTRVLLPLGVSHVKRDVRMMGRPRAPLGLGDGRRVVIDPNHAAGEWRHGERKPSPATSHVENSLTGQALFGQERQESGADADAHASVTPGRRHRP